MAAVPAVEKLDRLISVYSQRLQTPALQRLSVSEILGDGANLALAQEIVPTREELHITNEQDSSFSRLLKFLRVHEPTGYEKDETHKRAVVQYFALRGMLAECRAVKLVHVQEACVTKVLRWFEDISTHARVALSASTPILPPKMSPKKQMCVTPALSESTSAVMLCREDSVTCSSSSTAATAAIALERYKMPDLRASHIRRIAELKSRGADVIAELPVEMEESVRDHGMPKPEDYETIDQQRRVDATFRLYHPETDAEREMNLLWIQRRGEEAIARRKQDEVQQRVAKWSVDRSRDESEYLRKRESAKLVAGLERSHRLHLDKHARVNARKPVSHASQLPTASETPARPQTSGSVPAGGTRLEHSSSVEETLRSSASTANVSILVVKSTKKLDVKRGGMHFRNELPANYTPPSRHSNQSSSLPSSASTIWRGRGSATPSSATTPPSFGSGKQTLLETPNARTRLDSSSSSRSSGFSDDDNGDVVSDAHDAQVDGESSSESEPAKQASRAHVTQQRAKLEPYHIPYFASARTDAHTSGAQPELNTFSRLRMYPRGTIPPQDQPADPEFRQLYDATEARRVVSTKAFEKPEILVPKKMSATRLAAQTTPSNHAMASAPSRPTKRASSAAPAHASESAAHTRSANTRSTSTLSGVPQTLLASSSNNTSVSDLRQCQLRELERIRLLFEQNNLSFSDVAFERGLLVPEDRSVLECVANLPLAGSRLVANPLVDVRLKKRLMTKKKKKRKGAKTNEKKPKGSKSPKSSSRAKIRT